MGTDKETLYKQAMTQGKLLRKKITRRRMLQTSAAMAAAAVVTSNVREARAAWRSFARGSSSSQKEAEVFIAALDPQPTLVVHSGHGYQLWWLFEGGTWALTNDDERLTRKPRSATGPTF